MSNLVLGIIGGGQLGSLLSIAAKKINIKTVVFSNDHDAPAKNFSDKFIFGNYEDQELINQFTNLTDIITYEFENIPYEVLKIINKIKPVHPKPSINKIIQNRLSEKDFINKLNIRTTKYTFIKKREEIISFKKYLPGLLKTNTLGYDGKGQYKINSLNELDKLQINFNKEFILEKLIDLKKEISVIITRFKKNEYEIYEPIENSHEEQILKSSKIPATINKNIFDQSKIWATTIAEKLDYIGTLCVEFFIDKNNSLYVNEIAPRVHNSGHLTINAFNVSQFENHIRAVLKLKKIKLEKISNAEMFNILGKEILKYRNKNYSANEFFFDYHKKEPKDKRKMGHLTILKK
jgi:5-(carboxyamino)imidazole ribonucleotide synthase